MADLGVAGQGAPKGGRANGGADPPVFPDMQNICRVVLGCLWALWPVAARLGLRGAATVLRRVSGAFVGRCGALWGVAAHCGVAGRCGAPGSLAFVG